MSAKYVRDHYGVDFKRGDRVVAMWGGTLKGVVVSFPQQYVGVRFDGEKFTARVHPHELVLESNVGKLLSAVVQVRRMGPHRVVSTPDTITEYVRMQDVRAALDIKRRN